MHAVQLTSGFPSYKKGIPNITDCSISAMRKVSSNHWVRSALLVISKPAITISCVCICCLLMVARLYKVSKILRANCVAYAQEISLASLPKSSKADTSSLLLFSLMFQVMHLNVSKSQTIDISSRFSLVSVTGTEVLPMTTSFLVQDLDNHYFRGLFY